MLKLQTLYSSNRSNFTLDSLRYIPFSDGIQFEMAAGAIDRGGIKVGVYEIKAPYSTYMKGLDRQLVINLTKSKEDIERYPGFEVRIDGRTVDRRELGIIITFEIN